MIIIENVKENVVRLYSDNPEKKIHILKTHFDSPMMIVRTDRGYEWEEVDINKEDILGENQYEIDMPEEE